jgi:CelD/BcsL family acetyltransferase involved in cellulose biosynthesis
MIEVVSDLAGVRALGAEWNEIAEDFASPFLRHERSLALVEAFSDEIRPAVHVVRSRGRITAIAPLAFTRKFGATWLELLRGPTGFPSGPWGFLYRDEVSLAELVKHLLAGGRPVALHRIESDGVEARLLRELLPRRSVCLVRAAGACLWMPLGPSWGNVEARISSKRHRELRRERRRAEDLGQVRFEACAANEHNVDHYLQKFYRIEAAGWKARAGTAILSMPGHQRFYTIYARAAARLGLLRFYILHINDEPVAAQLVIVHGNRLWELKTGFDERFRRVSPGILLDYEILKHACERGYEAVEFLGVVEPYKAIWTSWQRSYCSIRIYPVLSLAGSAALGQDLAVAVHARVRRLIQRVANRPDKSAGPNRPAAGQSGGVPAPAK